jgi:arylsulfatase A-like enzyme
VNHTNRRRFLGATAAAGLGAMLPGPAVAGSAGRRKPNVLLVIADEWRAQAFGHAGDRNARTPALDAFAREACAFPNAVSGTPVCCPARASLLTGQYPLQHGVYINDVPLDPKGTTLGEAFAGAGYRTGYIGKWHVYGSPEGRWERRLAYIPPEKRFGFDYWKACECTHNYSHSLYYDGNDPTPRYWPGYDAIAQTQDAVSFIEGHAKDPDPFFLTLSWGPPHFPYMAPEEYQALYRDRAIDFRPNVPPDRRDEATEELRSYYAACALLDDCFRDLTIALDRLGIADDTIVLFMSDHGEMAWSQGLIRKLAPWEESVAIPLMVRYPAALGRSPQVPRAPINIPDVLPTLLGLAGVAVPASVAGTDYSPLLRGQTMPDAPASAYLGMPVPVWDARMDGLAAYRGVRTDRHTYVRSIDGPWLLYDNQADPFQLRNLVDAPAYARVQSALEAELMAWRHRLDDAFLPGDAYLRRDGLGHYLETRVPVGVSHSPRGDWRSTLPVPASQPRSIDASFDELTRDPLAAGLVAPLLAGAAKGGGGEWRQLSPRIVNAAAPQHLSDGLLAELDRQLQALPRP